MVEMPRASADWASAHVLASLVLTGPDETWIGSGKAPDGEREGIWVFEAEDGRRVRFSYDAGVLWGPMVAWDPNGTVRMSGFFEAGRPNGTFSYWAADGSKDKEIPLVAGVIHGLVRFFYSSGVMRCLISYNQGQAEGLVIYWRDNAELRAEARFDRGRKVGPILLYGDDGVVREAGEVKGEVRRGKWIDWSDGQPRTVDYDE